MCQHKMLGLDREPSGQYGATEFGEASEARAPSRPDDCRAVFVAERNEAPPFQDVQSLPHVASKLDRRRTIDVTLQHNGLRG